MMAWFHITTPVAFTLLWYFYLRRSRRVRATYSMGYIAVSCAALDLVT